MKKTMTTKKTLAPALAGIAACAALLLAAAPALAGDYTDNGDGTVIDNATGLMWQREDDNSTRTWQQALAYCESLELPEGGYDDWRLPNVKELESITDDSRSNPAIDPTAFPNTNSSYYWSSSTHAGNPDGAWNVFFSNGSVNGYFKDGYNYVRCVRDGQ
ncbi:MAG: DUF1566 domain-containing protein [Thermodesulfobacteriota bacterium]